VQKWAVDNKGAWVNTSPAVRGGQVYYGTADTRLLMALDARTGAQLMSLPYSWYFFSSPAIAGNVLYIGNWDGRLFAIDLTTRKQAWDLPDRCVAAQCGEIHQARWEYELPGRFD
jgi:outer membrane protein assembly factor BamB